jgi:hypothetical protein
VQEGGKEVIVKQGIDGSNSFAFGAECREVVDSEPDCLVLPFRS